MAKIGKHANTSHLDLTKCPLLLNSKQAAWILGVSESYLRLSRSEGIRKQRTPAPKHVHVGGKIRYTQAALIEWAVMVH